MRTLILIAVAFISLQGIAQSQAIVDKKEKKHRKEMRSDLKSEDIATLQSKKMTLALDLTEKQQAQVKDLILKQATTRNEKVKAREKMTKGDVAQKPSKEERLKMQNARLDEQIEMKKEMKSILTADQYQKWEKMQGKRMKSVKRERKMEIHQKN